MQAALLIHGAGGGAWEWRIWQQVFEAAGMTVAAPDLRPAAAGLVETQLPDYTAQMAAALSRMPRPRAVVGASLGGLVAMQLAHEADALVLVNPLPPAPWHAALAGRSWPDLVPWRRDARLASTRHALPDADDASALQAFRLWRDESGAVMRTAAAGMAMDAPEVPVLCIASGRDDDVPVGVTRELALAWNARLIGLPEASHAGPLLGRQAATVAAEVIAWLSAG